MKTKLTLFNYSQSKFATKINEPELVEEYEVVENNGEVSAQEAFTKKYDLIELNPNDFEEFKPFLKAIDWKASQLGMADLLVLKNGTYRAVNLLPMAIIEIIKKNIGKVNSQQQVLIIGEYHFVYCMAVQIALSGFVEIVVSLTDQENVYKDLLVKKIKSLVFDLNIQVVNVNELTTSDLTSALMISDFKKSLNKDAYELLTYFNFLQQGAFFIDCNSISDGSLVEDARKAEIAVIDETEVIREKYQYLREILKN